MKSKVVIGLIIVGIIFLGSATYALFNENLLLNDVASDIQTNDTTQSNNQHNIQNNQPNIQNNPARKSRFSGPCPNKTFQKPLLSRGISGRFHVNLTLFLVFSAKAA